MSLAGADFAGDDTLVTAVILSLCTDRLAQPHEVAPGEDRRGWWADAYATSHETSSDAAGGCWPAKSSCSPRSSAPVITPSKL